MPPSTTTTNLDCVRHFHPYFSFSMPRNPRRVTHSSSLDSISSRFNLLIPRDLSRFPHICVAREYSSKMNSIYPQQTRGDIRYPPGSLTFDSSNAAANRSFEKDTRGYSGSMSYLNARSGPTNATCKNYFVLAYDL